MSHVGFCSHAYVVAVVVAVSALLTFMSRVPGSVRRRQSGSPLYKLRRILNRMCNTSAEEKEKLNRKRQGLKVRWHHLVVLASSPN